MITRNITMDGKEYVLVPRKQWDAMARKAGTEQAKPLPMPPAMPDGNFGIDHVRISLANKMAARRKATGMTQAQIARLAGVRVETISRLENGLHMPGARTFDRIDNALNRANKRPAA